MLNLDLNEIRKQIAQNPADIHEALAKFLIQHDQDAKLWELYAHCLWKLQKKAEAMDAYEKALSLDVSLLSAHFGLAQALLDQENYLQALQHLKSCAASSPELPSLYFQIGFCYFQLQQMQEAKLAFEVVIKKDPSYLDASLNLGACYMHEEDYMNAIHHFGTACRLDEKNVSARFNLACALMKARRYLQARDQFILYLEDMSDDLEAQYHLGFVYLMSEALTESEACFQRLLDQDPAHVLALHNMANIALKKNEPTVALGYYQRVLSANDQDEIAQYMLAALAQKGAPTQAPSSYVEALFDGYAERFDQHLVQALRYQTPTKLYELWRASAQKKEALTILDVGCGTGSRGELLKPHASHLEGLDLSKEMLNVAREKNLYDALHQVEMLSFLAQQKKVFDVVVFADVLVYCGDLVSLFSSLEKIATSVLLSIESGADKDFLLSRHGRYQHDLAYVLACAKKFGFTKHVERKVHLRYQNDQPVLGWVIYFDGEQV